MEKYRMIYENGNFDDFDAQDDEIAKKQVIKRGFQGDISLYKYSGSRSVFEPWEHIGLKRFLGVKINYEWEA